MSDNNRNLLQGNREIGAGAYKKVMEIYFNEDSRNFVVVPAYQECPVSDNSENIPPEETESETEPASHGSRSCEPGVEPCKIQALNEAEAPRKSIAADVASTSEEKSKYQREADCEGPRKKIRRIGLPKSFKVQALHPNWKANVDE
ncbi:uncharacterized protein LOC125760201 [Rhipicephalus sanguineus]|uniref:uncharacterized protein LOC125760201 n=1 Tax=Rhipicephalus sanguineus TaxID=34632 RepID=UPI0020C25765|nr:uncharacterized protein LOC125760201 [Rhipicephalus sanguineus]